MKTRILAFVAVLSATTLWSVAAAFADGNSWG